MLPYTIVPASQPENRKACKRPARRGLAGLAVGKTAGRVDPAIPIHEARADPVRGICQSSGVGATPPECFARKAQQALSDNAFTTHSLPVFTPSVLIQCERPVFGAALCRVHQGPQPIPVAPVIGFR